LGDDAGESLYAKLVTERFAPGTPLYRAGDPADRVIFVISGHVEIATRDTEGNSRRVAVLAPGMHCGDLRLTMGEKRAEDATAVDDVVVRSLSRGAISAGMSGMLDRTPEERKIVSAILRAGSLSQAQLQETLPEMEPTELRKALDLLRQDGAVRESDGMLSVVQKRAVKSGAADILDRIGGLN
jgi:CRP-like cAMP-binding protein